MHTTCFLFYHCQQRTRWIIHQISQEDPLSPYIFMLWMEVLNHLLSKEAMIHKSRIGSKICPQAMTIPHLLFANDCLPFCKTKAILSLQICNFSTISSQLVHYHKSVLTASHHASYTQKQLVTRIFNIPHRDSSAK